jgi:hypothetical protein
VNRGLVASLELGLEQFSGLCFRQDRAGGIYINELESRVIITTYNHHLRLPFSRALLVGLPATKVYSGIGADIVMESITLMGSAHALGEQ